MKNQLAAFLLAMAALAAPLAAKANLIWYEGWNYANGTLTNVAPPGLYTIFSGSNDLFVANHTLQIGSSGGSVLPRTGDAYRALGAPYDSTPQVLYASFTLVATNLPQSFGTYFAAFDRTNSSPSPGGFSGRIQSFTNFCTTPGCFRMGATGNAASTNAGDGGLPVDLALNTTYQVVARLDPVNAATKGCTIWINPISESDTSYSSSDSLGFATVATNALNAFAFRQASSFSGPPNNWFCYITNIALATTFAEAVTNVQPTNAVPPVFGLSPLGRTNFTGSGNAFTLYGAVSGQGQLAITYQWYKNSLPYSNPNGNSTILPFSNPATTDSGTYTLVATTPYGLSSTSAPAVISLTDQPGPPKITSGPNSTNLYVGQSVTFSVQVSSPGNISYQWKSNGVNIDSANDSSYTIANLQTNFAASYSVGVTNDTVPNGVVSSNAVLTVSPAQQVSIGFLRTLVDPNTFLPNVSPTQPYQVTGTITTFTNITTGNTASYWLQDGTGGINIFATSGSTFRPIQGEAVTFTGVLSSFTSGLELDADPALTQTSYADLGTTNPLPAPIVIPFTITNNLSNVNAHVAGSLVTITNVYFGTNAGTTLSTTANQFLTVTNAAGQSFVVSFFDLDLDTAGQVLPAFAYSVTGVLYGLSPSYSVAVTKFSDIVTNQVIVNPIPLTVVHTNGSVVISWSDASFTLQSSTNVNGPYTNVTSATSPYTNATTGPAAFYRLKH